MGFVAKHGRRRWTHGMVPFIIENGVSAQTRAAIGDAANVWNRTTHINVFEDTTRAFREDCLIFRPDPQGVTVDQFGNLVSVGCSSNSVGKLGGSQIIRCGSAAIPVSNTNRTLLRDIFVHEIGHAIGLLHEHQRPDRDHYIAINGNNITPGAGSQFSIWPDHGDFAGAAIGDYDVRSVMHYDETTLSVNGQPTINVRGPGDARGILPSPGDIKAVDTIYPSRRGHLHWNHRERAQTNDERDWAFPRPKIVGSPWQHFRLIFAMPGTNNVLYAVNQAGELYWYRHTGRNTGSPLWQSQNGTRISGGWQRFKTVVGMGNGVMFAIEHGGAVKWYRHEGFEDGSTALDPRSDTAISAGWNRFTRVVGAGRGVLYALESGGILRWFGHFDLMGANSNWAPRSGSIVVPNWDRFRVFACDGPHIYAVDKDGDLTLRTHRGHFDGSNRWVEGINGVKIAPGWGIYDDIFCPGDRNLYGIVG